MVEIELDGKKVEVPAGSMVMHAAEKAGTYIPHFCYHKKLSIAANCRMCLVDVEKAPKPMPACATPVTQGMVVRTKSDKAIRAQKSVMEFLLINHPLDCPICDQGGECQLQDLAVGYGGTASRYEEEKRVVLPKDVGPLISMEEMSRCIHCTRCVRFGQEVAGVMELGMSHRGEHAEIESFVGATVDSEISGNMIDLCPVGALTSKPFRYAARTWELSRRRSVSPHDSTGANLTLQVKNHKVVRVVPFENEQVNECWIADRDRFSYEALSADDRLTQPMIKQGGSWMEVEWQVALEYIANGLTGIKAQHGAKSVGCLISPHSTVEELYLAKQFMGGLESPNIDSRLRSAGALNGDVAPWLGRTIASLGTLDRAWVIGSNLRKDHPLLCTRIRRAAVAAGCQVHALGSTAQDWAMPLRSEVAAQATRWVDILAEVASELASRLRVAAPVNVARTERWDTLIESLVSGSEKAILLGNAAAHHSQVQTILYLANWIGDHVGATVGFLGEAANTVGAQLLKVRPGGDGVGAYTLSAASGMKAMLLHGVEVDHDVADPRGVANAVAGCDLVVTLSPFKVNMDISDVLLPVSPFSETSGSFVNTEGRLQSFHAAVKPLGETRPGWKVWRALGNLMGLPSFDQVTSQDVLNLALPGVGNGEFVPANLLSNKVSAPTHVEHVGVEPCVATIYQLDALVRRSPSLQRTRDGREQATKPGVVG